MCDQKLLTISIAAYNVEETLQNAVESCFAAGEGPVEVIIVNDGSTDGTIGVARSCATKYPNSVIVVDKSNAGYGSTINASIARATGKYFRYLDGDDWFDKKYFKEYIDILAVSSQDMILTPYRKVYEDGSPSVVDDAFCDLAAGTYNIETVSDYGIGIACTIAYRTEVLRKSNFKMSEHCFYCDTEYAALPLPCVSSVYICHLPIYQYRLGSEGQSVSSASIERHYKDLISVRKRIFEELEISRGLPSEGYSAHMAAKELRTAYEFILRASPSFERLAALKSLDRIAAKYPSVYKEASEHSKKMRLLHATAFIAYWPLCTWSRHKTENRPF